jgi:hypothetical protein
MKKYMRKVMETGKVMETKIKTKHEWRTSRKRQLFYLACSIVLAILLLSPMLVHADVDRFVSSAARHYGGSDQENECVDPRRPCLTIQHAIDVADDGDIIKVAECCYEENIVMDKGIFLTIEGSYSAWPVVPIEENFFYRYLSPLTWISGTDPGSIVSIRAVENENVGIQIDRVVLHGGWASSGGAISVYATTEEEDIYGSTANLILKNSILLGNTVASDGGAIHAVACSRNNRLSTVGIDLSDNLIVGNNAGRNGGAIEFYVCNIKPPGATGRIRMIRNEIRNNTAAEEGGGISVTGGDTTKLYLENNIIASNTARTGAAIYARIRHIPGSLRYESLLSLLNDTITDNISSGGSPYPSAGIYAREFNEVELVNVILWGNHGEVDMVIPNSFPDTITKVSYSDIGTAEIRGTYWEGAGNVSVDPEFVDPDAWDYHLRSDSPLLDAGICGSIRRVGGYLRPAFDTSTRIAPHEDFERDLRPFPGDLQCESWVYLDPWRKPVCGQGLYLGCSIGADDE